MQAGRVLGHIAEALDDDFEADHSPMDMLERSLSLAAFCMRRMIEKRLVTDVLAARLITVLSFSAREAEFRPPFHGASGGRAYSNYRFRDPKVLTLQVKNLVDEIIHSSQLMIIGGDDEVTDGLLIASDWHLKRRLLHLTSHCFDRLVQAFLDDHVFSSTDSWDPDTGKVVSRRV